MKKDEIILSEGFPRREFLRRLTVLGAGAVLLPLLPADAAPAGFVPAGAAADFPPGVYHAITLPGGTPIHLRRLPGRTPKFQALSALCTHKGCRVSWVAPDKQFRCPCHAGRFDASGRNIAGPPPVPLAALKTKVVKGIVLVSL